VDGALLLNKPVGVTSFGALEELQRALRERTGARRSELPKLGHGGTLDPFATGLLVVCVGRGAKLARYFLGSRKRYEGVIRFGETTVPGDPTEPVSERSEHVPDGIAPIRELAHKLTLQPYLQTPPMHSAKKVDGRPLYELARQGKEVEREPKLCTLHALEITEYAAPRARFRVECSSGTYVRVLAQDLGRWLGTVAMLESLHRSGSGRFSDTQAWELARLAQATREGAGWDTLPCWVPFDQLLSGTLDAVSASVSEEAELRLGRQNGLPGMIARHGMLDQEAVAIYRGPSLVAVARREPGGWALERVF
jgi:tRNA pseudouridine55 synthase